MVTDYNNVKAGAAIYSPQVLAIYDLSMLTFFSLVWRCPTSHVLRLYNDNISSNHLDVGVGSGYYLDHCHFPNNNPRISLLDLNQNSLAAAARRIARHKPKTYLANVLEPISIEGVGFDSIGLCSVLHCLPGNMKEKGIIFDHLKQLMNPGGVIFGCTLINVGIKKHWFARQAIKRLNSKKIFCNLEDNINDLWDELSKRFHNNHVKTVGCMALFTALRV